MVHELQLERGISILYINDKEPKHTTEIQTQRTATDKDINEPKNLIGRYFSVLQPPGRKIFIPSGTEASL